MASKSLLCVTFLCFFPYIANSSSNYSDSIASAPSSSVQSSYGSLNLQFFSSLFSHRFKTGYRGSRRLASGSQRGRSVAEVGSNRTRGAFAPAPAPAPVKAAATSSRRKPDAEKKKEKPPAVKWLLGIALGLATGAVSAVIASIIFRVIRAYLKREKPNKPMVFQRKIIDAKAIAFLEAAGAADSLELLGKGGSGAVYKTTLENGKVVAIKKVIGLANLAHGGGIDPQPESSYDLTKNSSQIKAELDTLGQIRHRNLVTLLAYIPLQSAHLLVYEYMENGSLRDVLRRVDEGIQKQLPWETRFSIAEGIATGLKYLHFECDKKIVHCDLKPGNILLDKDMVAHIGDFGLARIIPDSSTHFTSKHLLGTLGYIPPEYHQTLRYTTKGDVYGLGVVLVVLLTGKEPTHHLFSEVFTHLGSWLADLFASGQERMLDTLDPCLRGHGHEPQMLLTFKVASFCLNQNPENRPTSSDILKMLAQIRGPAQPPPKTDLPFEAL